MDTQREKYQKQMRERNTELAILSEERQRLFKEKEKFESQAKTHKIQNRALSVTVSQMQVERNHRKQISEKINLSVKNVEKTIQKLEFKWNSKVNWLQIFSQDQGFPNSKGK